MQKAKLKNCYLHAEAEGLEPTRRLSSTSLLSRQRSTPNTYLHFKEHFWSSFWGSNPRPLPYQGSTLPSELKEHIKQKREGLFRPSLNF